MLSDGGAADAADAADAAEEGADTAVDDHTTAATDICEQDRP